MTVEQAALRIFRLFAEICFISAVCWAGTAVTWRRDFQRFSKEEMKRWPFLISPIIIAPLMATVQMAFECARRWSVIPLAPLVCAWLVDMLFMFTSLSMASLAYRRFGPYHMGAAGWIIGPLVLVQIQLPEVVLAVFGIGRT